MKAPLLLSAILIGIVIILINGYSIYQQKRYQRYQWYLRERLLLAPSWFTRLTPAEVTKITAIGSIIFAVLLALASII